MTTIDWDQIRIELARAVVLVQYETPDGHDSPRLRIRAADHVKTVLLLLSGSHMDSIIGHVPGTRHSANESEVAS